MRRAAVLLGLLSLVAGAEGQAQRLLHAGAYWAALERPGGVCEAVGVTTLVESRLEDGSSHAVSPVAHRTARAAVSGRRRLTGRR